LISSETPHAPQQPSGDWRAWTGFTAMSVGMFLAILDIQIVASSLIDIQFALSIPQDRLSYIQTTYLIAEVIAIALTGFLTRVMSTRWLFTGAMIGFVLASIACAASGTYITLYIFRFIQGLFGGAVIPIIFSAAFLMFPKRQQPLATVIGGGVAMLAPTVGPFIGGWITETLSWHWLFLVNVVPGIAVAAIAGGLVQIDKPAWSYAKKLDGLSLALVVVFLAALELTLKESPGLGWASGWTASLAALCFISGWLAVRRCVSRAEPLIDLSVFRDRTFAVGAWFSFVLGMALFGAIYLLPLFLGIVRGHGPLAIGTVMIVTGIAQLIIAPVATFMEQRLPLRAMTAFGFVLLAAGLISNGFATYDWDFDELLMPQILRGAAFMICLLPITRLALGQLPPDTVANGSALFNLMRNIGGAVGLALIDTIIEVRAPHHAERIIAALQAGSRETAEFVGLPLERFNGMPIGVIDETTRAFVEPLVERAATVASFNDAWLIMGALVLVSLFVLPMMKRTNAEK
tara:strand:+ start:521 stop:2074 length:1554 start_codon:yes stop_codon:yes gene_type:complete